SGCRLASAFRLSTARRRRGRMGLRFNPAPGWPPPPPGFVPPPDWRPDPSWPPAPPGWQLWVTDDTMPDGFGPIGEGVPPWRPPGLGAPGYVWAYARPPSPGPPNSFAVACFIISFFGFTVIGIVVSVVFGILALLRIRERPQRGRGFAVAGLVISTVWFLFFV